MRVLIAEDETVTRRVLTAVLNKLGHTVEATSNGREAWAAFHRECPHVLISDWMMPDLDGLELTRLVRAESRPQYTYVILLTALSGKGSYLEGMNAGADDFVTKPLDPELLRARLQVASRILNLQAEVRTLQGLLPICAYCRKIRNDDQTWSNFEEYVREKTSAELSHGICASCYETRMRPQIEAWKATRA